MSDPISKVRGMTPELQSKLEAEGIKNTAQLLEHAKTEKQRSDLAKKAGTTPHILKELANRADLMRLKGVGEALSNLLEEAGVNSCKELQHRKPDHLHKTLVDLQAKHKLAHHTPTVEEITTWIAEAKTFSQTAPE
jgi:predicted flap endonuclease-1-like 5' DNA nuclease